jgi:hypothetical protein
VDVVIEDGVAIILNKQQPYKIKGETSIFSLKEDFIIDFEGADLATSAAKRK